MTETKAPLWSSRQPPTNTVAPPPDAAQYRHKVVLEVDRSEVIKLAGHDVFVGSHEQLAHQLTQLRSHDEVRLITTPNVDQALDLEQRDTFFEAYTSASLRLFDGMPLVLLARMLGAKSPQRHTGADLLPMLASMAPRHQWTIAIAGGSDDHSAQAAENLTQSNPGAKVVSVPFPHLSDSTDQRSLGVIERLHEIRPDFTFLCLGSPKQEEWFLQWRKHLPAGVYVGAGAAVDFAAGRVSRAPVWVQRACLEWAWRLAQEPARLAGRYLVKGPRFAGIVTRSLLHQRTTRSVRL